MPPSIAATICIVGILGLFWLDRDSKARTSIALWIPMIWLGLACSRPAATWLGIAPMDSAEQVMEGSPVDRLVYTGLLLVAILVVISRNQRVMKILKANGPIILFFLYCAVSIVWSDYPGVAFKRWFKALGDLTIILIVLSESDATAAIKRFLARPAYVLIPLSILFIKYYPQLGTLYGPWGGPRMNTGVTMNKNTLGAICLCFGLAALWRFLAAFDDRKAEERTRVLVAQGVILSMVVWLLYKSNSMTSTSCFLMASILMLLTRLKFVKQKPAIVHFVIVAMLAASASVLFLGASPDALATMGRDPTVTGRTEVWGWLFSLVQNPLVGAGFESYWLGPRLEKLWSIYWWHPNEAHNGYIEIYLNLGWIGIMLLAVVLVTAYRKIGAAYRNNLLLANLALAYFLVGLTYNFTEAAFFRMLAPTWIFFLFAVVSTPTILGEALRPAVLSKIDRGGEHRKQISVRPTLPVRELR
jgi:exopolysaccharide production protein ExoQ